MDVSHPRKQSVNDGIEPELCLLSYTSVDEAVQGVVKEGCGTVMATVNDGIEPELCSLSYTSVDEAVQFGEWSRRGAGQLWQSLT